MKSFKSVYELFDFEFLLKDNIMFIKGPYGYFIIYMPSEYYLNNIEEDYYFLFVKKYFFVSIYKQFLNMYIRIINFFYIRLKLKGLGYRMSKMNDSFYRFFFAVNNFYYFHVPNHIYLKKKNVIY